MTSWEKAAVYSVVPGDVVKIVDPFDREGHLVARVHDLRNQTTRPRANRTRRCMDWTVVLDPISGSSHGLKTDDEGLVHIATSDLADGHTLLRHVSEGPDQAHRTLRDGRRHLLDLLLDACGDIEPTRAIASIMKPDGRPVGYDEATAILDGRIIPREWMLEGLTRPPSTTGAVVIPFVRASGRGRTRRDGCAD